MYAMSLVERLGYKSLQELYNNMDGNEIMEWLAYDKLHNDEDFKKKLQKERDLEQQENQSASEESDRIRNMFRMLGLK